MRNLLRNKWTVGVLALVAAICIYTQLRPAISPSSVPVAARQEGEGPDTAGMLDPQGGIAAAVGGAVRGTGQGAGNTGNTTTNTLSTLRQVLTQLTSEFPSGGEIKRDPFSREIIHREVSDTPEPEVELATPQAPLKLELQAISIQSAGNYAVINGRVVGAGDRYAQFTVESVVAEGVWLTSTNGRQCLKIDYLTPIRKVTDDPEAPGKP